MTDCSLTLVPTYQNTASNIYLNRKTVTKGEQIRIWKEAVVAYLKVLFLQSAARLLSILCGANNFGNIWPACGQNEIQYTE